MPIAVYKSTTLISQPRLAKTQWEKARGLMFSKFHDVLFHFPKEERLKFHMVFVFYPIDIIFMDDEMRVVDFKKRFKPFSYYYSKSKSSIVLETYSGFIDDHEISIGDQLAITHDGEIPMKGQRHTPQTKMLHTTSLGNPRSATANPVASASKKPTTHTSSKKTPSRAAKPVVKKTAARKPAAKKKVVTKKPATRTSAAKKAAAKPARKTTKPAKKPVRTSATAKKPVRKAAAKKPATKKAATKKPAARKATKKPAARKSTTKKTKSSAKRTK